MISAELEHNPYLLITDVWFNGQKPNINSRIEKYEHTPLKEWVNEIPGIFYDEMNGYDFDLFFTGTKIDFHEIEKAFARAGASKKVRIIHKNELEDPLTKSAEIDNLLLWLKNHPNNRFPYQAFMEENQDLFEGLYPYYVINGPIPSEIKTDNISIESVKSAEKLPSDLSNVPILFYIDDHNDNQFRKDLNTILERKDIRLEQLFFMILPLQNVQQIKRVISDLGVPNPQVVSNYEDEQILSYIKNYPITDYIREAIYQFFWISYAVGEDLEKEKKSSLIANAGIHSEIDFLENDITKLKAADEKFVQRDNYTQPVGFEQKRAVLLEQIHKWKNKKTKLIGENEIENGAAEYVFALSRAYDLFSSTIKNIYDEAGRQIFRELHTVYSKAGINIEYSPATKPDEFEKEALPDLKSALLGLKKESYVEEKVDFFGLFKKSTDQSTEPETVITCSLEEWRMKVQELLMPVADEMIHKCNNALVEYYDFLSEQYHYHLSEMIKERIEKKEQAAAHLSGEERMLQYDNDWLSEFRDYLQVIERG